MGPQKAVLRERGSSCKHLSVRVHTYIVTYVCSAEEKRGEQCGCFCYCATETMGEKENLCAVKPPYRAQSAVGFFTAYERELQIPLCFHFLLLSHCSCTSSTIKHRLWTKACARRIAKLNNGSRHLRTWNATRQAYEISVGNIRTAIPSLTKQGRHP